MIVDYKLTLVPGMNFANSSVARPVALCSSDSCTHSTAAGTTGTTSQCKRIPLHNQC